jgi:hypothetical protein
MLIQKAPEKDKEAYGMNIVKNYFDMFDIAKDKEISELKR